jgi:hypothetical protein|nr:MAG TPA: helix-turn-helix protein [Caudoviricetes sp.]
MFYKNFIDACKEKGTTPWEVCTALNLSRSNVTAWKSGREPNLSTVVLIAKHLGVNTSVLVK